MMNEQVVPQYLSEVTQGLQVAVAQSIAGLFSGSALTVPVVIV